MRRARISSTLSILPLSMILGNGLMLWFHAWWANVFVKGSEQLFKHSIDRSSLEVLYMAIPDQTKIKTKSFVDTLGNQGFEGLAGVILVCLFSIAHSPLHFLSFLNIALSIIWISSAWLLQKEYPRLLESGIGPRQVDLETAKAKLFTPEFYQWLPELRRTKKETALYFLDLLETSPDRWLGSYLSRVLSHSDPEVKLKAIRLLFHQDANLAYQVEKLVHDRDRGVRVEAIHYVCLRGSAKRISGRYNSLFQSPDLMIRAATCSFYLRSKDSSEKGCQILAELIEASRKSGEPDVRVEIAHVLQFALPSNDCDTVCEMLLSDSDASVCKAILKTIAITHPSGLVHRLIEMLRDEELRPDLQTALARYGDAILPELDSALKNPSETLDQQKQIMKVLSLIGGKQALQMIVSIAMGSSSDHALHFAAIKALNRMRKLVTMEEWKPALELLLKQEIDAFRTEQLWQSLFRPAKGGLMDHVFHQHQIWARQRVFRILGLLYDPEAIYRAYLAISGVNNRQSDTALELLDSSLNPGHRETIIPLLEDFEDHFEDPDYLEVEPEAISDDRKRAFISFLREGEALKAAAAVLEISEDDLRDWKSEIRDSLSTHLPMPLVEETLRWRYHTMDENQKTVPDALTTAQKLEKLNQVDLFKGLGPHELLLLADQSQEVVFEKDESIYNQGDPSSDFFCLISGRVRLERDTGMVEDKGTGDSFGMLTALTNEPRLFSATAMERSVCLKLDRDTVWRIIEDYPDICQGLLKMLFIRIQSLLTPQRVHS